MQRIILRTITVLSVMCFCCLFTNEMYANLSDYGPPADPILLEEVSLTCPAPITVDCDENGIYTTFVEFEAAGGSVNLPDGCVVDSFTFVADVEISQNGCTFVYFREYFISETCGNTFTCNQIVMLTDDDDPVILDCPSDTTFQVSTAPCTVGFDVPDVMTSDGCSSVTVTNDAPMAFPIGVTLVTYTATDACGNFSTCAFNVTVENTNSLTVNCPPAIDDNTVCDISGVPPYADFAAFEAAGGSVTGDCIDMGTIFTIDSVSNEQIGGSCPITVNRTYYISDDQGNQGSCVQAITITDDTDPTFTVPADAMGVECTAIQDTSVTGSPSNVMDNCDMNPVVTFVDSDTIAGSCVGEFSFTRTWTVTDACGNDTDDTQNISVVDTTPPTAVCQDTVTLYLDALGDIDIDPADLDNGSSDSCSDVSFTADMSSASCNQVGIFTTVMLEVSDDCGNTATCDVLLTVLDTLPVVLNSPENDTTDCIDNIDLPFVDFNDYMLNGGGSVVDNCPAGNTLDLLSTDTSGTCPTIITRLYQYTDNSMNSDTAIHTIVVFDEEPPMIISCPPDISITETDICDTLLVFGNPVVTDNCEEVIITNDYTNDGSSMAVFTGGETVITFTISDECGNSTTCSTTVTLDAEPQITCPPMGIVDSESDLPDYPTLQDFLNAGGSVNAFCAIDDTTFMYSNTFVIDSTGCGAVITENISVNDTLGNPITVEKMSAASDTLNPVIVGCFTQFVPLIHETCEVDTTFISPTVTDNFGVDTTYFVVGEFVDDTATVVFYGEDLCGNIDSCDFELIIFDPTSPDIELDDITIMCDTTDAAPIYTTIEEFLTGPGALIYDCRLDSASFTHIGDVLNMDGTISRTYSIDDLAGNNGTTTQIITIMDSTPPEFTMCSPDVTISAETDTCGAMVDVVDPTFMDNCNGTLTLTNDYNGTDDADDFYPVGITTVLWTVEDENGLTDTCSFTVEVFDNTNPSITCPSDTTIVCSIDAYPAFTTIAEFIAGGGDASDNCDLVSISEVTMDIGSNMYTREYTVTDANGLQNSCVQDIEVIDTIAPELVCVPMIIVNTEINTCDKFITITPPTATDDCDDSITITNSLTGASDPSGTYSGTTSITWYAEDDFGNIDSCTYDIIVVDATGPVVSNADTTMIMCEDMLADVDTFMMVQDIIDAGGSATDNCGIEFVNLISQIDIGNDSIKRTYEVVDTAGNTSTLTHCIVILDVTEPEFTMCSGDVTISAETDTCGATVDVVDPTFMDNCGGTLTLTNDYNGTDDADDFYPVGVTTVIWTVEDENGLTDTCSFTVEVIDNTNPSITCSSDTTIVCSIDAYPAFTTIAEFIAGGGDASDNCDLVSISEVTMDIGSNMYTREYTVTDANGLQNSCVQDIEVIDTIAPELVCVPMIIVNTEINTCDKFITITPPTATDDCDDSITITNSLTGASDPSGTYSGTTSITWYAEDDFGNIDSCTYDIIVVDATGPVVSNADTTMIMCEDMLADVDTFMMVQDIIDAGGSATDNCGIEFVNLISQIDIGNDSIKRTYEVVDTAGNTSTLTHCIVILDVTEPEFTMCSGDVTISAETDTCGATVDVVDPTFMDNCGGTLTLTNDYNGTDDADDFYPVGVTTVIWTVEDENGLTDTCSFTVEVIDNTNPSITCSSDTTIVCSIDAYPAFTTIAEFIAGGGEVSDNCDLVSISEVTMDIGSNMYTREYTITDANGLQNSCVQDIEVIDTTAPMLMCVTELIDTTESNTCDKFITIDPPTATDNCDMDITITNSLTGASDPSGTYSGTTSITWYAEDDFGNIDSCTYDIIVVDAFAPEVSNPDTVMIMCLDMLAGVDTFMMVQDIIDAGGSATDNCGIEFVNFVSQVDIGNDSIKRTYEIIDSTGNTSMLTHCIVIDDTTPPMFTAPDDVTVECDDDVNDLALTGTVDSMMLTDNCMDIDTLIYTDSSAAGVCPIISEISRVWILTDNSGNETRDTQLITTIDTVPPVFDSMPAALANIDCDDDFPMQETLTATDACTGATVVTDTLPFVVDLCNGYDVTYLWIAVDGCDNRDTASQTFSVNPDDTAPELVDINDITVDSEGDICGVRVDSVPGPLFDEDCVTFELIRDYSDTIYHVGVNFVDWIARNDCGLDSVVTQEVTVVDNILPTVLCKDATAGITADPQNYVFASSFVDTATDNCGIDSIFVRRLTAACDDPDNNVFGDSIHICCDDVGTLVEVEIRVVDESGNENFCDATLQVDDERAPIIEAPLPNITVSCSYVIDTLYLEEFGSFTADPGGREDIIVEDIFYESTDSIAGIDGLISDECEVMISDSTVVDLDECCKGTITRIFTFTDVAGNTSTSEQTITVIDVSPFNENGMDIIWPENFTWENCLNPAPDTSVSGSPIFLNDDKCALVSATYKDQPFNFPTNICPKIRRKWEVIDWCQYDDTQDPNPGVWTYNQFIIIENVTPPTITTACTDTLICTPNNECSAFVSLGIEAEDDCADDTQYISYSYTIDVNSDSDAGNDISGQSSSFNVELDLGVHEVTWVATDRCGNEATCSYFITLNECKAPTAVCLFGLAINLDQNGEAELWASDVNQSSFDNCTAAEDLILSFSSDVNDFGMTFDCDDAGTTQNIELWVTDEEGNQSFCSTFVDVQDNNGYCNNILNDNGPTSFQGKIATETEQAVPGAMVSIVGAEMDNEFMTEEDGEYAFDGIEIENDYQVTVDRDKDPLEGVSTLDLVMIQRHILGLDELDSPYKLIAADINDSESVTASDLVALRKVILGIDETFPDNQSWRFVSQQDKMDDMSNPWPFGEDLILGILPIKEIDSDFVGVKIGDVNNSVDELITSDVIENRNHNVYGIVTKDQTIRRDDEVLVDFLSGSSMALEALQMTIEWDKKSMNLIDIIPIGIQLDESYINTTVIADGKLTIAWSSVDAQRIEQGTPFFQLKFEGNESFRLSDRLEITSTTTEALAYDENDASYDIELRFDEAQEDGLLLMQNKPNPFAFETIIEFSVPEDMEVTFKVFNGAGSMIYKTSQYYNAGKNSIKLNEELGEHTGLLFIKMETAEFSDVKRMIRIE